MRPPSSTALDRLDPPQWATAAAGKRLPAGAAATAKVRPPRPYSRNPCGAIPVENPCRGCKLTARATAAAKEAETLSAVLAALSAKFVRYKVSMVEA